MGRTITLSDLAATVSGDTFDETAWSKTLGPLRIEVRPPSEEARAIAEAARDQIERMHRTSLERIEAAARAMLRLAPSDALDTEKASAEIERRNISLVSLRASDAVELREGDVVRWRGRRTWEDGQATWSEEWVTPHVYTVAADVEGEVPAGTLMVLRPDGTVAPGQASPVIYRLTPAQSLAWHSADTEERETVRAEIRRAALARRGPHSDTARIVDVEGQVLEEIDAQRA